MGSAVAVDVVLLDFYHLANTLNVAKSESGSIKCLIQDSLKETCDTKISVEICELFS